MTRSKSPKNLSTPTTNLRTKATGEPDVLRAEISVYRQKIAELVEKSPLKASVILTDWLKKESPTKKAA